MRWPLFWATALTADLHESSIVPHSQGFFAASEMNMIGDVEEF
jgi:hypothetical protein